MQGTELKVRIGPIAYDVIVTSDPISGPEEDKNGDSIIWGRFLAAEGSIKIRRGHFDSMREAALHEVFHAMYYVSGLPNVKNPNEEQIVSLLSPYFTLFLMDDFNRDFLEFFGIGNNEKPN